MDAYELVDALRVAIAAAAAADVDVDRITAAQAAADLAWAEVSRIRRELFETIQAEAGVEVGAKR